MRAVITGNGKAHHGTDARPRIEPQPVLPFGDTKLEFLNHYGLFNNGSFTNACIILFAKNPIRFLPQARLRLTEYAEGKTDNALIREGDGLPLGASFLKYLKQFKPSFVSPLPGILNSAERNLLMTHYCENHFL